MQDKILLAGKSSALADRIKEFQRLEWQHQVLQERCDKVECDPLSVTIITTLFDKFIWFYVEYKYTPIIFFNDIEYATYLNSLVL